MTDFIKLKPWGAKTHLYMNPANIIYFYKLENEEYTRVVTIDEGIWRVEEDPGYILNLVRQFTNK